MTRMSTSEQLKTLIVKLGGVPQGRTVSELVDQLEDIVTNGGGVSPADLDAAVGRYIENNHGGLTQADMDDIFGS